MALIQGVSRSLFRHSKLARQSLTRLQGETSARCLSSVSPWTNFEMAPLDPIVGLNETFNKDDFPQKVIVGVGAYRDDTGKPYVLPCVREAEKILMEKQLDMEYAGIVSVNSPSFFQRCDSHDPFLTHNDCFGFSFLWVDSRLETQNLLTWL